MKKLQMGDDKKKKWENFWYYYKLHVLAGVFVLFCIGVFIHDKINQVSYDYSVAFLGSYGVTDEDRLLLQSWFEEHAEDLNGDGEVHVQISDYYMQPDDAPNFDPQVYAASQTRFTVDAQEGTSMLFFMDDVNYNRFKDIGIFPESEDGFFAVKECQGFEEAGSPGSIEDMRCTLRLIDEDSKMASDEAITAYYAACQKLIGAFTGES